MFPKIKADLEKLNTILSETKNIKSLGKAFVFNYTTGQHLLIDGKMVECSLDEAVAQWIEKVLRTELGKYGIYTEDESNDFGISVYRYIGEKSFHMGYIASELKREITEQMLQHRFIESIEDYTAKLEYRTLHITFTAVLLTGSKLKKEVNLSGV